MLVSFSLENWKSFKEKATFSLVASKERAFRQNLPHIAKHRLTILPFAAVYGGNASGKSNLFQALSFVRYFVLEGSRPDALIPAEPFLLDSAMAERPSCFSLAIIPPDPAHIDWIYEYSFSVTRREVLEEKLVRFSSSSEEELFVRRDGKTVFGPKIGAGEDAARYNFVAEGTRSNQLFLTNSVSQNIEEFKPVYDWFRYCLIVITPADVYVGGGLHRREEPLYQRIESLLTRLDTGIVGLEQEPAPVSEEVRRALEKVLEDREEVVSTPTPEGDRLIASRKDGEWTFSRLMALHRCSDGKRTSFRFAQESDGTNRLLDLLPTFAQFSPDTAWVPRVCIFDEIDRSLHTLLVRQLIEDYLNKCSPDSRWQILVSTHDVMLMDQSLLRRDEMWLTDRDDNGCSTLSSVADFMNVRSDLDIARHYLLGRMGGVPRLRARRSPAKSADAEA